MPLLLRQMRKSVFNVVSFAKRQTFGKQTATGQVLASEAYAAKTCIR